MGRPGGGILEATRLVVATNLAITDVQAIDPAMLCGPTAVARDSRRSARIKTQGDEAARRQCMIGVGN